MKKLLKVGRGVSILLIPAVEALKDAGIRDQINVIIGGAPCNVQVRAFSGADYYTKDAVEGVNLCKKIHAQIWLKISFF